MVENKQKAISPEVQKLNDEFMAAINKLTDEQMVKFMEAALITLENMPYLRQTDL